MLRAGTFYARKLQTIATTGVFELLFGHAAAGFRA